jgi:sugar lactone lactonase YvrE
MLLILALAVMVGIASYAMTRRLPPAATQGAAPAAFLLDREVLAKIDPALLRCTQVNEFPIQLNLVRAVAVGPGDGIYVAGDRAVQVFDAAGQLLKTIAMSGEPTCLTVGGDAGAWPGRIFVGIGNRVESFNAQGARLGEWTMPSPDVRLTSITTAAADIFVADAAQRVVWRFDGDGRLLGRIGAAEGESQPFSVPSPYFDVAAGEEGLIHVVNPGRGRIETVTPEGSPQTLWGAAGSEVERFFGCCNPAHLAVMPDGSFVTSEKGIPRIKVYDATGKLESVVAGPEQLGISLTELGDPRAASQGLVFDVAADRQGRILVLDPKRKSIRIFLRKASR